MRSATKRILSIALAICLLGMTLYLPDTLVVRAAEEPATLLGQSAGLGASLGLSINLMLVPGNTITVIVDGVNGAEDQLQTYKDSMSVPGKSAVTTARIEVRSGQSLERNDTGWFVSLSNDFPNLRRLEIDFDDSGADIPASGFYMATWIVELESNAGSVEERAFYGCDNLRSVHLPDVTDIGDGAFHAYNLNNNNIMEELHIPNCRTLGEYTFERWYGFGRMTIGDPALNGSFDRETSFFSTVLTTQGNSTSFFNAYPRWLFQSVDGGVFFHSLEIFRGSGAVKNLGSFETGDTVSIPMERDDGTAVTFSLESGTLPSGLRLDASGRIAGTPTSTGDHNFTLRLAESGKEPYTQNCIIRVTGEDIVNPVVRRITPGTNQMNIPTDGAIVIEFSEPMDTTAGGTVELLWNNNFDSMILPAENQSWDDTRTVLTAPYSGLTSGQLYWIYLRGFKSSHGMLMTEINQYDNYYFRTEAAPEQPQVDAQVEAVEAGEEAIFQLTMGVGDQRADWAQIVNYDGLTKLAPDTSIVHDDCEILFTTNKVGTFSFRVNFYKNGQDKPFRVATSYLTVRGYYHIAVSVEPEGWGTVIGAADAAPSDEMHVVTAIPADGYRFARWSENGTTVSLNSSYYFTPHADRDLVAHFTHLLDPYQVVVQAVPPQGGTVTGTADLFDGDAHTVTARAAYGYYFVNWTEFGEEVSHQADYTFTVERDRYLTAHFSPYPHHHVQVSASPAEGGVVTGTGTLMEGTEHTITAVANPSFQFTGWTENGEAVSTEPAYTFTVAEDRTLVAEFLKISNPASGGSTSGGGSNRSYAAKQQIPASAFSWDGQALTVDHVGLTTLALLNVRWDGELATYSVWPGSVVIRFDTDFLAARTPGNHTVRVEFWNHVGEVTVALSDEGQIAGTADDGGLANPTTGGDGHAGPTGNPGTGAHD